MHKQIIFKLGLALGLMTIVGVALASEGCPSAIEATRDMTLLSVVEDGVDVADTSAHDGYRVELQGSANHFTLLVFDADGKLLIREIYNER